jgi:hypothetical protein
MQHSIEIGLRADSPDRGVASQPLTLSSALILADYIRDLRLVKWEIPNGPWWLSVLAVL